MTIFDKVKNIVKKEEARETENKTEAKNAGKDFKKNKLLKDKIGLVVLEPLFTEKTSNLAPLNKYVFKIANSANKNEVKKAIEGLYEVNVTSVNIIKTSAKPKRVGRRKMIKPGFKKAIVTLKAGESLKEIKR